LKREQLKQEKIQKELEEREERERLLKQEYAEVCKEKNPSGPEENHGLPDMFVRQVDEDTVDWIDSAKIISQKQAALANTEVAGVSQSTTQFRNTDMNYTNPDSLECVNTDI